MIKKVRAILGNLTLPKNAEQYGGDWWVPVDCSYVAEKTDYYIGSKYNYRKLNQNFWGIWKPGNMFFRSDKSLNDSVI